MSSCRCGSVGWSFVPNTKKAAGSSPGQGTYPGFGFDPGQGTLRLREAMDFLSLPPLLLPLLLSKKSIQNSFKGRM